MVDSTWRENDCRECLHCTILLDTGFVKHCLVKEMASGNTNLLSLDRGFTWCFRLQHKETLLSNTNLSKLITSQ